VVLLFVLGYLDALVLSCLSWASLVAGTTVDIGNGNVIPLESESICAEEAHNTEHPLGQRQFAFSVYSHRSGVAGICAGVVLVPERNR